MIDAAPDHIGLTDLFASRRYFAKFDRITGHLARVAAVMQSEGDLSAAEVEILTAYVQGISYTFRALSMKSTPGWVSRYRCRSSGGRSGRQLPDAR